MAPVLCYWDVRGLAQPIRFLLHHAGVDFEDKRFEIKSTKPDEVDFSEWMKEKFTLGMPFPSLPYYIDEDVKLSQSLAIMRYLARKHNLDASTEEEQQTIEVMEQHCSDLEWRLTLTAFTPEYKKKQEEYLKTLPDKLKLLESFLEERRWIIGDRVTYVDFLLYESLDHHRHLDSTCLEQFPNLSDFMNRIEALPNIKKYMESGCFKSWPLYGPSMHWGYHK